MAEGFCGLARWLSLVALAGCLILLLSATRASAITGGSAITVEQAPWQAEIEVSGVGPDENEVERCGATIIAKDEVLTAAHCLYDWYTEKAVLAEHIKVLAGTANVKTPEVEAQTSAVSQVRIHPYFVYEAEVPWSDDVALLTLKEPLTLGARVKTIGLVSAGAHLGEGGHVELSGFGEEAFGQSPDGELHSIGMTLLYPRRCSSGLPNGAANALFLCASSPTGAACFSDGGNGLTAFGSSPELAGVLGYELGGCEAGDIGAYANVGAPEIQDFITDPGSDPPRAPRGAGVEIRAVPEAGHSAICVPGNWSNSPTYTYTFISESVGGAVLQQGSSSIYLLSGSNVGKKILCEVQAINSGGTGVARTSPLGPIGAPPSAPSTPPVSHPVTTVAAPETSSLSLDGGHIAVTKAGVASVKLACLGKSGCHGRVTLVVKRTVKARGVTRRRTVSIGAANFTIVPGATVIKVKLTRVGRSLLGADHGHLSALIEILGLQTTQPVKAQAEAVQMVEQKAHRRV
jgi:Trypsin